MRFLLPFLILPVFLMNLVTPEKLAASVREPITAAESILECPAATVSLHECEADVCYPALSLWSPTEESVALGLVPSCGYCFCLGDGSGED